MSRSSKRYRVHLAIRYGVAAEFVREYAENLSNGGLFIAGATALSPLQMVYVELDLPGFGKFRLKCQVAHVLDADRAAQYGYRAGAGLEIVKGPEGYKNALMRYLQRLGRRADHRVLTGHDGIAKLLGDAGYQVTSVSGADELLATVVGSKEPVIAVVVGAEDADSYRAAAEVAGAGDDLVLVMSSATETDAILARLDERL